MSGWVNKEITHLHLKLPPSSSAYQRKPLSHLPIRIKTLLWINFALGFNLIKDRDRVSLELCFLLWQVNSTNQPGHSNSFPNSTGYGMRHSSKLFWGFPKHCFVCLASLSLSQQPWSKATHWKGSVWLGVFFSFTFCSTALDLFGLRLPGAVCASMSSFCPNLVMVILGSGVVTARRCFLLSCSSQGLFARCYTRLGTESPKGQKSKQITCCLQSQGLDSPGGWVCGVLMSAVSSRLAVGTCVLWFF